MRLRVKTEIDLPIFTGNGQKTPDGRLLVSLEDICDHLTAAANTIDAAGGIRDIGITLRAIRDGLAEADVTEA